MSTNNNFRRVDHLKVLLGEIKHIDRTCLLTKIEKDSIINQNVELEIKNFLSISSCEQIEKTYEEIIDKIKETSRNRLHVLELIADCFGFDSLKSNTQKVIISNSHYDNITPFVDHKCYEYV